MKCTQTWIQSYVNHTVLAIKWVLLHSSESNYAPLKKFYLDEYVQIRFATIDVTNKHSRCMKWHFLDY